MVEPMIRITVPKNRSGLSILGLNTVSDGDTFESDYYVYRDGKRVRKWFSFRRGWSHFWPPVLDALLRIETLHERFEQRIEKNLAARRAHLDLIRSKVQSTKTAGSPETWVVYAKPTHSYEPSGNFTFWRYEVYFEPRYKAWTFCWHWVEEPSKILHLDLGMALYKFDHGAFRSLYVRASMIRELLDSALIHHIRKHGAPPKNRNDYPQYQITVNGRDYWYVGSEGDNGQWVVKQLSWPRANKTRFEVT